MRKLNFLLIYLLLLSSCSGMKEAGKVLRNEKTVTTDEFLVKKKEPLVMPPDYNEIPTPDSVKKKKINDKDRIKKVLNNQNTKVNKKNRGTTNIENSIIERIR